VFDMGSISCGVYVDGRRVAAGTDPAVALAEADKDGGMLWVGLDAPTESALTDVASLLELNHLAVRDCLRGNQRSKLEAYGAMHYLVLHPARYHDDTETVERSEVALFVTRDRIVSVQRDGFLDQDDVRARLEDRPEILAKGTRSVVWMVMEAALVEYGPVLDGVENDIDEIEEQLFTGDPDVSKRIFKLQREVIDLQHATAPLPDMIDRLGQIAADESEHHAVPAFGELGDAARHVSDRVEAFRNTLASALSVHATLVEQENNEAMRRMTETSLAQNDQVKKISSWAAILVAPTLVGTVYGMNFTNMPELHWAWGYPAALGLMLASSLVLYVVFKRKDWL